MQTLDKPKIDTETRTDHSEQTRKNNALMLKIDAEREARRTQRTIPAEKPTLTFKQDEGPIIVVLRSDLLKLNQQAAHADKLAEALRTLTHAVEQGRWIAFETCVAWSQKALTAYEESK